MGSQLRRSKKFLAIRGLNKNHNHDLKNIFKGDATRAAATAGPFQDFYEACIARGVTTHTTETTKGGGFCRLSRVWPLDEAPEITYERCTSPSGCRCVCVVEQFFEGVPTH